MKILIVSCSYYPEIGAAPVRITNLATGLREKGCQVDILTCMPNYPKAEIFDGYKRKFFFHENIGGVDIYRYIHYPSNSTKALPRALSMFSFGGMLWFFNLKMKKIRSYDRVIIQTPPIVSAYSAVQLFKLYGKKIILNVSDLWPLSAVELGAMKEGSKIHRMLCRVERNMYRQADMICGQSQEILDHITAITGPKNCFLYRNLQKESSGKTTGERIRPEGETRIVYAGLLGIAQDILSIIKHIDFKAAGCQFHLYGAGNQAKEIEAFIQENRLDNIIMHGPIPKKDLTRILPTYHASIVPLTTAIKGAVPSKIFDLISAGIPILFCGGGEGAKIVEKYGVGLVSSPSDYPALQKNLETICRMPEEEYNKVVSNQLKACANDFNFDVQMEKFTDALEKM